MFDLNRQILIGRIRNVRWLTQDRVEFEMPQKVFFSEFRDESESFADAKSTWFKVRESRCTPYLQKRLDNGAEVCVEGETEMVKMPYGDEGRSVNTVCVSAKAISMMSNELHEQGQPAERVAETVVEPEDTYGTDLQDFGEDLAW